MAFCAFFYHPSGLSSTSEGGSNATHRHFAGHPGYYSRSSVCRDCPGDPPKDLTVDVRGSATLDPFHIQTKDFKVDLKKSADVVVQEATFLEGGHTGWHSHPGTPVVIVKKGLIRLTRADGCTSDEFGPGESFVEAPGEVLSPGTWVMEKRRPSRYFSPPRPGNRSAQTKKPRWAATVDLG
jgi:hypothetical protein